MNNSFHNVPSWSDFQGIAPEVGYMVDQMEIVPGHLSWLQM